MIAAASLLEMETVVQKEMFRFSNCDSSESVAMSVSSTIASGSGSGTLGLYPDEDDEAVVSGGVSDARYKSLPVSMPLDFDLRFGFVGVGGRKYGLLAKSLSSEGSSGGYALEWEAISSNSRSD